ncbi:MAG: TraB/GumN family protein [Methylibium sp.]|nr:TraB/GumN family protein [Methylibium sp.]
MSPPPPALAPATGSCSRRTLLRWLPGLLPLAHARARAFVATTFDQGLLWRIQRPGIAASHLFGTVHLDDARVLEMPPAVHAALDEARVFLPELRADAESGRRFEAATQLPPGQSLRALSGEAAYPLIAAVLATRYGIAPAATNRLKPWAAYLALEQPTRRQGEILDGKLQRLAVQRGLPVVPLESLDEQIASLEAVPLPSQLALLEASARAHDEQLAAIDELLALYLAEDLAGLWRLQRTVLVGQTPALRAAHDDLIEHLLLRRNARMVERLLPHLRQGGAFAAMGALHLHGEQGLPARLARLGWSVERRPA